MVGFSFEERVDLLLGCFPLFLSQPPYVEREVGYQGEFSQIFG